MEIRQSALGTGFDASTTAEEVISGLSLDGKVAIVTGGHSGLGLETTRALSIAAAKVVVGSRDVRRASAAVAALENVQVVHLDLSSPAAVDQFAEGFMSTDRPLDILINKGGVRRWAIDPHVASDLWKLSERLTEVNWPSSCRPQAGTPL